MIKLTEMESPEIVNGLSVTLAPEHNHGAGQLTDSMAVQRSWIQLCLH